MVFKSNIILDCRCLIGSCSIRLLYCVGARRNSLLRLLWLLWLLWLQ
jgi:hypothetical protein